MIKTSAPGRICLFGEHQGRISIMSPLGRALLGKEEADEVEFVSPSGARTYEVLEIFT